jgi:hypothetical protein
MARLNRRRDSRRTATHPRLAPQRFQLCRANSRYAQQRFDRRKEARRRAIRRDPRCERWTDLREERKLRNIGGGEVDAMARRHNSSATRKIRS